MHPEDHSDDQEMISNTPPLPLAGEGWGEGGLGVISPLTFVLSPRGEEIRRCPLLKFRYQKIMKMSSCLTYKAFPAPLPNYYHG